MVEGQTEGAFKPHLVDFLRSRLRPGTMPKLVCDTGGRLTSSALQRDVAKHFKGSEPADFVVALTDVYTGSRTLLTLRTLSVG